MNEKYDYMGKRVEKHGRKATGLKALMTSMIAGLHRLASRYGAYAPLRPFSFVHG